MELWKVSKINALQKLRENKIHIYKLMFDSKKYALEIGNKVQGNSEISSFSRQKFVSHQVQIETWFSKQD